MKSILLSMSATIVVSAVSLTTILSLGIANAKESGKKTEQQDVKSAEKAHSTPQAQAATVPSDIPGITTPDKTPHACIDCHKRIPDSNMDFRLTTILAGWINRTDSLVFQKGIAAAPAGVTLEGKHPDIAKLVILIPNDCLMCHSRNSWKAPPFTKLLHGIHLAGGVDNHFVANIKGNCTSCHKLDQATGAWHLGSGREK